MQTEQKLNNTKKGWNKFKMRNDLRNVPSFIPAIFLNGDSNNINTMPMLKIWTPPPDMYSINACIGRAFAGATAASQARFSFKASYDAAVAVGFFVFDWVESLVAERYNISFTRLQLTTLSSQILEAEEDFAIWKNSILERFNERTHTLL